MSTLDIATGEIVAHMSATSARQLTDEIRGNLTVAYDKLVDAFKGRADLALEYESWDAYCAAEFSEARMLRPTPEQRREIVASMRGEGMSTRAIGSALGVDKGTVRNDLRDSTGESSPVDQPDTVTSLDGRQRPATQPPRAQTLEDRCCDGKGEHLPGCPELTDQPKTTRDLGDVLEERMPGTRADLARTSLRARWAKDMAAIADVDLLDMNEVRALIDNSEAELAIGTLRGVAKRLEQAGRPGLRVVGGSE